ncbi:MAG: DegT/DnrJ/EryC1/StrS family aminotransferase [Bauldia sp.]|nr:DegT/DnrJ/EryC1/StrS family aminotransferase [Bauldia sp.]
MLNRPASTVAELPFIDLAAQRRRIGPAIEQAIGRVLDHGKFILGPEIDELEAELGVFCGADHVVSCANGTDALSLILLARGIGPGDAVICPSFTFAATAEVVALVGATPVFADVLPDTFNLDPASVADAIRLARRSGLNPAMLIAVDLFGQPADYEPLEALCAAEGLFLLADAAQSFGATYKGRKVGTIGDAVGTSFFPAKPLGCYGDGGAVFTNDAELAGLLRSLRVHGQGKDRYDHPRVGINSRLDAIQAAILLEKLRVFPDEIVARQVVARRYSDGLADLAEVPFVMNGATSVWAQYTLRITGADRAAFQAALRAAGIPTMVYYPVPLHRQPAYRDALVAGGTLPVTDALSDDVVSLPMHPYLDRETQDRIIAAARDALGAELIPAVATMR